MLLLFVVGCDCSDDDMTTGFGPRCGDSTTSSASGAGSSSAGRLTLLVTDRTAASIRRFSSAESLNSAVATDLSVSGNSTRLSNPRYLSSLTTTGELIVCDQGSASVLFFANASTATGNVAPTRVLTGANTRLSGPVQAYHDASRDELYILDSATSSVLVFAQATSLEGNVAPIRTITGASTSISSPSSFFFDSTNERMTVVNPTELLTFSGYRQAAGSPAPSGRVSGAATRFTRLVYGMLTDNGTLILADSGDQEVLFFENFQHDQNNVAPTRVLSGQNTGLGGLGQFFLDSNDDFYLVSGSEVLVFSAASTVLGNSFPTRRFSGTNPSTQTLIGLCSH